MDDFGVPPFWETSYIAAWGQDLCRSKHLAEFSECDAHESYARCHTWIMDDVGIEHVELEEDLGWRPWLIERRHPSTICEIWVIYVYTPWCACTCMDKTNNVIMYVWVCAHWHVHSKQVYELTLLLAIFRATVVTSSWSWRIQSLCRNRWGFWLRLWNNGLFAEIW